MAVKPAIDVSAALREQMVLISFVILFAGLVATDTYYAAFGIRFQLLDFSIPYLVYRGLTAAIGSYSLILVYVVTIAWLASGAAWLSSSTKSRVRAAVQPLTYLLVLAVAVATYFGAVASGRAAALRDQDERWSELPVVQSIAAPDGKPLGFAGCRMLLAGKDSVVLFKPVANSAEVPLIHIIRRDAAGEIVVSR